MAKAVFNIKWYFNTPEMIARLGKWRNDTLARVGAYGHGVFRKKLGRPQLVNRKARTVHVHAVLTNKRPPHRVWVFDDFVYVPQHGLAVNARTRQPVHKIVARRAAKMVAKQVKGTGEGKPPRMGPTKKLRDRNEFSLDSETESVVIGTVPFPPKDPIAAASVPELLDKGLKGWINSALAPAGGVFVKYSKFPYVDSVLPIAQKKLEQLIERRPVGTKG